MKKKALINHIYFPIFPKDDPKQALRIRRFFMAFAAYILAASLDYFSLARSNEDGVNASNGVCFNTSSGSYPLRIFTEGLT